MDAMLEAKRVKLYQHLKLWEKLKDKCLGSAEIVKNKKKLLKKEFDLFGLKNESVCKMIERFGHLKLELARHGISYPQDELVDKLFDSLYGLAVLCLLKNTIKPTDLTVDLLIERLESHELELKKTYKVNHLSYQQNLDLYYPKSMMPKNNSPKTAFSTENVSSTNKVSRPDFHVSHRWARWGITVTMLATI
ncbi:hypothetical protein HanIR_Chr14g0690491 [Helianthus annuus]|nr:hypothetical protein HanIR_Chr14g0690491 [Helianthus annuus]